MDGRVVGRRRPWTVACSGAGGSYVWGHCKDPVWFAPSDAKTLHFGDSIVTPSDTNPAHGAYSPLRGELNTVVTHKMFDKSSE